MKTLFILVVLIVVVVKSIFGVVDTASESIYKHKSQVEEVLASSE